MVKKKSQKQKSKNNFDKYWYYRLAVQSPEADARFIYQTCKKIMKKEPITLCEDFCGTFLICCEWVKLGFKFRSVGVDIDSEPLKYGEKNHLSQLTQDEQARIALCKTSVLDESIPSSDIVVAQNFSYYLFKTRAQLKSYIKSCYERLNKNGVLMLDCFGGSACMAPIEEVTELDGFTYYWDQDSFDPVSNQAQFYIHFKPRGNKKYKKVFSYDWRLWSLPEIREVLEEVGFQDIHVYWEGTDENGEGDGKFVPVDKGEDCESWIAYVIGQK